MTELLPPPPKKDITFTEHILATGWYIIVCPDTDLHRPLAQKLSQQKPGQIVPLSVDEMALLSEFMVWPNPRRMG